MKDLLEVLNNFKIDIDSVIEEVKELKEQDSRVRLSTLKPGEIIKGKDHDYIVLKQDVNNTHIISKDLMLKNVVYDEDTRDYGKSNIRSEINKKCLPIFEKDFGMNNIVEHKVDLTSVDMQIEFPAIACKVRPLTFDEAREFNDLLVKKELGDWYWTCTPWSTKERNWKYVVAVVSPSGFISDRHCNDYGGVRPFCIFSSSIFESEE